VLIIRPHFFPALKASGLPYSIGPKRLAHDIKTLSVALIPHFLHFQKTLLQPSTPSARVPPPLLREPGSSVTPCK